VPVIVALLQLSSPLCSRPLCSRRRRRCLAKASSHLLFLALLVEIYHMLQKDLAIQTESYIVILFVAARTVLSRILANEIEFSSRRILIECCYLKSLYLLSTLLRVCFK